MIRLFLQLTKFPLSLAVTLSAVFGFFLAGGSDKTALALSTLAVLLLALGVSALNQYQERETDGKMARTRHRPLPSGRISPFAALLVSETLIALAMGLAYLKLGWAGLGLFLFVVLWYNGLYTSMKKWSAFAVVPGGVLGAIPPAIGWLAAGGGLDDPRFLALALFYFVWQVPHFWLLALKHHKEYEKAGFPTAVETFGEEGFRRVLFVWWMLTVLCGLFTAGVFGIRSPIILLLLLLAAATAAVGGGSVLSPRFSVARARSYFHGINLFLLGTMVLLSADTI